MFKVDDNSKVGRLNKNNKFVKSIKDNDNGDKCWGLLKMDFLGLRNLTILSKAVDIIEKTRGIRVDLLKFPLDDKPTFELLRRGETKGVFQLESGGIRDLLQRMKPDHFRDIIATNALYRPGPLEGGMVDDYIAVKLNQKKANYLHPILQEILEETHGCGGGA
jgi:DNA polymerase-3 subunit alpha